MRQARSSWWLAVFIFAVAALGTAWIVVRTQHGALLTTDSAHLVSGAENIAAGKGYVDFQHRPLWWWPPGYSISLAGLEVVGIGAFEGGRFWNAALFGATILASGLWLKWVCRSAFVVATGVLTIAGSRLFQKDAATLSTDALGLMLTVAALIGVSWALKRAEGGLKHGWLTLAAGLLAGLSAATRYIGVVAIASSLAVILLWHPSRRALWSRMRTAVLFGLAASLPVVLVLARNIDLEGAPLGRRLAHSTGHTMTDAVHIIIDAHDLAHPTLLVPWIMVLAAVGVWLKTSRRTLRHGRPPPADSPRPQRQGIDRSVPFAAFALLHVVALIASQPSNDGLIQARLVYPAAIALVFVGCEALDAQLGGSLAQAFSNPRLRLVLTGPGLAILLALGAAAESSVDAARRARSLGHAPGDVVHGLVDSAMIDHLDRRWPGGLLYSNRAEGTYLLTGIQPLHRLPRAREAPKPDSECLELLRDSSAAADMELHIAWFDESPQYSSWEYCDIPRLASISPQVQLTRDLTDGAIYRFVPDR